MSSASFRQHFDTISMHEPIQRKAKFWTSYVGALKGTQDMRAEDNRRPRPLSSTLDVFPRIFDDFTTNEDPASRINSPGYRYQPVSRETYGYTPRPIHSETRPSLYLPTRR